MGIKPTLITHLAMIISQLLCPDNPVQICLHEFLDDCDRGSVRIRVTDGVDVAYNKSP